DESFGSRHRAALGITEETDAVLVVVSEERGSVSFCFNGNIVSDLDGPRLRAALEGIFSPKKATKRPSPGERLWSMLPAQLLRRRSPERPPGKEPALSEAPGSVRIRATIPSGIPSGMPSGIPSGIPPALGADGAPLPATTKPLRKTAAKPGESSKSNPNIQSSLPPRAPDEST
ncbi:MAG: hypothetical protein RL033_147, partial [Pseudomonadota bacterium]